MRVNERYEPAFAWVAPSDRLWRDADGASDAFANLLRILHESNEMDGVFAQASRMA